MNKRQEKIWLCIAVLSAIFFTVFTLSHFVTRPWHSVAELGGDGIKNTFTYLYHSVYDKGMWFQGMNYPYGEHIVYTDAIPVVSVLLSYCKGITPNIALTVLWWLIALSYVLCMVYIYLLLVRFKVGYFFAILFAALICVCSPQIFRIQSHYALSFNCVIPMLFYWTMRYYDKASLKYALYIFIAGCITAFIHPYFALVIFMWVVLYAIGYLIFIKDSFSKKVKHGLPLLVATICMFIFMGLVMKLTDPIKDRPRMPFGTFDNRTKHADLYTSDRSPIWMYVKEKGYKVEISNATEGYAYLGLAVVIILIITIALVLYRKVRRRGNDPIVNAALFSPIWLFIAFLSLLFSMGIPLRWMMWVLDYVSVFRQFRALGRFNWLFYYIITVYASVMLYHWYSVLKSKNRTALAGVMIICLLGLWGYEAAANISFSRSTAAKAQENYAMFFSEKEQTWPVYLQMHHHTATDFQGILLLKFFHIGTEKLWVGDAGWLMFLGTKASMQLHLPIIDVLMSRSSWSQAEKQVKNVGGPFTDKPMLRDLKNNKPFLLLKYDNDTLDVNQLYLLSASDSIGHFGQCNVYACYPQRIIDNDKQYTNLVRTIAATMRTGDTCIGSTATSYIDHYDGQMVSGSLFGQGALSEIKSDSIVIKTIPIAPSSANLPYEFSCWYLLGVEDYKSPEMILEFLDTSGKVLMKTKDLPRMGTDNDGLWFRSGTFFTMPQGCTAIRCSLTSEGHSYRLIDELQLRPANALIISKNTNGRIMANNHLLNK